MKNKFMYLVLKYSSMIAVSLAFVNIMTMCSCINHQPVVPQSIMLLKKHD